MPQMIRHINLADQEGRIYCCLRNKVVLLDEVQRSRFCAGPDVCRECRGLGVECLWKDSRPLADPYVAADPAAEFLSNQKKKVPLDPVSGFTAAVSAADPDRGDTGGI
ncbi:hypothetical protein LJK87_31720 [Paenibacillus sp. P25]|nr:hypothetical protein LJK87_31720 [Paenibacillus sp. P25]